MTQERAKRVLLVSEATFLSSGYGEYGCRLMEHLYRAGYELMELSSFAPARDERISYVPWKFKTALWDPAIPGNQEEYFSHPHNKWGAWKFEESCIEFQPDVVLSFRDSWMDEFIGTSPLKPYFTWIYMPAVDAIPQKDEWVSNYKRADKLLTYTDWAASSLPDSLNKVGVAPPCPDYKVFYPVDKRAHREAFKIDPEAKIVGTVMRNQRRKLFPDLFEAFRLFLDKTGHKNAYLYCHTSWPEKTWDLPTLIKSFGLSNRVMFTYCCKACGAIFPAFFQDAVGPCKRCGEVKSTLPNTHYGVPRETLANIMRLFDLYVQYSTCEGFGMPTVEAAACGVPVAGVDYSATADIIEKLGGLPIPVGRYTWEPESGRKLALPDNEFFANQLACFFEQSIEQCKQVGDETFKACQRHYQWEATCKVWEEQIGTSRLGNWAAPAAFHEPVKKGPNLPNAEFVRWCMVNVAGRPDLVDSYLANRMITYLNWEATEEQKPFSRENVVDVSLKLCAQRNNWEAARAALLERT